MLLLYGGFYAATDGMIAAMASAVFPAHLRTTGLAILGTSDGPRTTCSAAVGWGATGNRWGPSTTSQVFMIGLVVAFLVGVVLLRPGRTPVDGRPRSAA